jgi:hypothetical protein
VFASGIASTLSKRSEIELRQLTGGCDVREMATVGRKGNRCLIKAGQALSGREHDSEAGHFRRRSGSELPNRGAGDERTRDDRCHCDPQQTRPAVRRRLAVRGAVRQRCCGIAAFDRDVTGIAEPTRRILLQASSQQLANRGRCSRRQLRHVRICLEQRREHFCEILSLERARARQHFVEHAAERPDVRAPVDGPAARLFRRRVADSTEHQASAGHQRGRGDGRGE